MTPWTHSPADGAIGRELFELALHILGASILQAMMNAVSPIWVGRYLGETALAAVANAQPIVLMLTSAMLGMSQAAAILVGQCAGAGSVSQGKRIIATGMMFFALVSVLVAAAGTLLAEPMLVALQTPAEARPLSVEYLRALFFALPSFYLFTFVIGQLRGIGDSRTPLWFLLLTLVATILGNHLLVAGFGVFRGAGVVGAALAFLVAQTIGLVALVGFLYRRRHPFCLHRDELHLLKVDWSVVRILATKGIPLGAQAFVLSLSTLIMLIPVNHFGVHTVAAFGAALQLWGFVQLPAFSIGLAVTTMVAMSVGARHWNRVSVIANLGMVYAIVATATIIAMSDAFAPYIFRIFLPADSQALAIAAHINEVGGWSFVLMGICMVLFSVVRGVGAVVAPLCIYAVTLLVVRFSVATAFMGPWEAEAIWWSFPVSATVAALLALIYYRYGGWRSAQQGFATGAAG